MAVILGPILWPLGLVVAAFVAGRGDAIGIGLLVAAVSRVVAADRQDAVAPEQAEHARDDADPSGDRLRAAASGISGRRSILSACGWMSTS